MLLPVEIEEKILAALDSDKTLILVSACFRYDRSVHTIVESINELADITTLTKYQLREAYSNKGISGLEELLFIAKVHNKEINIDVGGVECSIYKGENYWEARVESGKIIPLCMSLDEYVSVIMVLQI